ncbi:hypothetical protein CR513_61620, partial [Mucuna pruriens]
MHKQEARRNINTFANSVETHISDRKGKHKQEEMEEENGFNYAMQLVNSSVLCMAMQSAIELGIFDIIGKAGVGAKLSAKDIAAQLPCKNPEAATMLDRILRLLATHSIIDCTVVADQWGPPPHLQRLYGINTVSKYFACIDGSASLGPLMLYQLKDAILEGGIPFNRVHGKHVFEYSEMNSSFNQLFMAAMTNRATLIMKKIVESYKGFEHINRLVDVGGGLGVTLNIITSKYPHIKGINFDLPHVIEHASPYPGVEHVGGNMFESVPEGDAILIKCVLHDWSDEWCLKVLKKCHGAIPNDGKVIVVEGVLPIEGKTTGAVKSLSQFDVLMMTTNPGGKERSEEEFMALAKGAGFSGIRYTCFVCDVWVMEFFNLIMAPSSLESTNGEAKQLKHVEEDEDGILFAMTMMSSVVFPLAVRTAVELGIFDIIARAGEGAKLSAEDIIEQVGTKNPEATTMLDRILRLLTSHSMLSCSLAQPHQQGQTSPKRLYTLTYASKTELKGAIVEGGVPFNRVYGMHAFEYPAVDPRFNDVFNKAMFNTTTIVMNRVLELYEGFKNINRLVDVGGGLGINLNLITSKYPHVQAINFDLPHVVEHAPNFPGVEHVGGDMFESVPKGDAIFMKWILHDWSDEHCLKLLKNCYKAIPSDGKVIAVDSVLPVLAESSITAKSGFQADVLMLTQNPGGKERTRDELMELALGSGFTGIRFICYVSGFWVMEFFK